MADHPSVRAVREALRERGASPASVEGLRILPDAVTTARAAADAIGVEVGQIANSLVFVAGDEPLLVLTSGAHRVDTAKVATRLGLADLGRADKEFVREATGQVIGGVAPVGHPSPLRTLVDTESRRSRDEAAARHWRGSTSCGRPAASPAPCSPRRSTSWCASPGERPPTWRDAELSPD